MLAREWNGRMQRVAVFKAAIDGRLPHGMGVVRLSDMPADCSRQHLMLGFNT